MDVELTQALSHARRVAVFGGSFDPPHLSHLLAVAYLRSILGYDRIVVVPVFEHAFDKRLTPFAQRVELCRQAFEHSDGVVVTTLEANLPRPSYTLNTVEALRELCPTAELRLVVGSDVLAEIPRWHRFERVMQLAPLQVLGRAGHPHLEAPVPVLPELSSTQVRRALREPRGAEQQAWLCSVLSPEVLESIKTWALYRCT